MIFRNKTFFISRETKVSLIKRKFVMSTQAVAQQHPVKSRGRSVKTKDGGRSGSQQQSKPAKSGKNVEEVKRQKGASYFDSLSRAIAGMAMAAPDRDAATLRDPSPCSGGKTSHPKRCCTKSVSLPVAKRLVLMDPDDEDGGHGEVAKPRELLPKDLGGHKIVAK